MFRFPQRRNAYVLLIRFSRRDACVPFFQQRDAYVRMFRLKGCQCNADCMEACDTVRMSLPLLFVTAAWSCVCTLFHLLLLCVSIADGFALLLAVLIQSLREQRPLFRRSHQDTQS